MRGIGVCRFTCRRPLLLRCSFSTRLDTMYALSVAVLSLTPYKNLCLTFGDVLAVLPPYHPTSLDLGQRPSASL